MPLFLYFYIYLKLYAIPENPAIGYTGIRGKAFNEENKLCIEIVNIIQNVILDDFNCMILRRVIIN